MWNGELIISGLSMCWVFHTLHELFNLAGRKTCLVMRPRNRGCETSTQQEPLLDMEAVQKEADRSGRRKTFRLERVGNPIDMRMRSPSPLRRQVDCTSASRSTVCTPSQSPFIQLPINPCFRQRHERTPPLLNCQGKNNVNNILCCCVPHPSTLLCVSAPRWIGACLRFGVRGRVLCRPQSALRPSRHQEKTADFRVESHAFALEGVVAFHRAPCGAHRAKA